MHTSICNIKPNRTDYYISTKGKCDQVDQSVILRKSSLKNLYFVNYHEKPSEDAQTFELYPYANSYYNHTEDSDALNKVNSLLAQPDILEAAIQGFADQPSYTHDAYSERDAQIRYLESEPICFIILGKPDIGQQELGRNLAHYWNCMYIGAETLIEEEINSASRAGECIEFNLRCGRAVGIDIILKLVEKRVKSESARHRGFVIAGLPVIPNDLYEEDPESSQSAIFTAKEIFEEVFGTVTQDPASSKLLVSVSSKYKSDIEQSSIEMSKVDQVERDLKHFKKPEEEEGEIPVDIGETISDHEVDIGLDYEKQLSFLFNLLKNPYFIIYVQCSTIDALNKRDGYRFDIASGEVLDTQRRRYNRKFQRFFLTENEFRTIDDIMDTDFFYLDDFRHKNLVKMPYDFKANVASQLDRYHYVALNFIQNRVLAHDPQYFLKLDGRTNIDRMLNLIKAKLKIMKVQPVLIPKKLTDTELDPFFKTDDTLLAEDQGTTVRSEPTSKDITPEECFKQLKRRQTPSQSYLWSWSEWGNKCPVSLKKGFDKTGSAKYAVQFMNKIFFLTNFEAYIKFYRNPRPFLLPPYPRTTCKIFIFGPRLSGRSALAQCLAYYYNGTVLSMAAMMKEFLHRRQFEYLEKVKQQAIAEGIALLNKQRKAEAGTKEKERIEQIKEWVKTVVSLLEQMNHVLDELEKEEKTEQLEISSFPMAISRLQTKDILENSEFAVALSKLREEVHALNVPIYKLDVSQWQSFVTERKKLLNYLPPHLSQRYTPKPATVFDDFVKEYVQNALATAGLDDMGLAGGSILEMFISYIKEAEKKYEVQGLGRGGWIIDGMMSNLNMVKDFYPDYVGDVIIVLQDSDDFLVKRYGQPGCTTFFRNFRDFFLDQKMYDAAWRSPLLTSTHDFREGLVTSILEEILDNDSFYDKPQDGDDMRPNVQYYKNEIDRFNREWAPVKQYYLDNKIDLIEIDVSNKTLPELFLEVIGTIDSAYGYKARQITDEDNFDETPDKKVGSQTIDDDATFMADDMTLTSAKPGNAVGASRKYGDTYHFCPVTFSEDFVLWKGQEDFAVTYNEQVYLLSTRSDMEKFIKCPSKYLLKGYQNKFPPPRICLVGVSGCGKTILSKAISENYGLSYISYEDILKRHFKITTKETLNELRNTAGGILSSYLRGEQPLPDNIMEKLKTYWFDEPFKSRGFVLDDFPKSSYDFDFMTKHKLIPELVLNPFADDIYIKTKFLEKRLTKWRENMERQRAENEIKQNKLLEKWRELRVIRFNTLIEERREQRYTQKLEDRAKENATDNEEGVEEEEAPVIERVSQVTFDSVAEQEDFDEVNKLLDVELPPPVFDTPEGSPEEFISKTQPSIDNLVERDSMSIKTIRGKCKEHEIVFSTAILNLEDLDKTKNSCFIIIDPIKFKTSNFFETCYDLSLELADRLLSSGYYFLSKFGKACPVQFSRNKHPVHMYMVHEQKHTLFPVLHRSYIYFIGGYAEKNRFIKNPLKYINQEYKLPLIEFKIGITGPPKCGKTTLAERIQAEYGFKIVTKGQAVRYVLKYLSESDLAKSMESVLRKGWELTDEMTAKSVEAAIFDKMVVTQGVVYDGFPVTINETRHLSFLNILPHISIDLDSGEIIILEYAADDKKVTSLPKYGQKFVSHLYSEWQREANNWRPWFDREYQAAVKIPVDSSTWCVWHRSKGYINSCLWEIKHYHRHIVDDWPLRLGNMLVTPLEFLERLSVYKSYCPVCLHYLNVLNTGGDPPDRTGLVQFRNYFYWLCNDHIDAFLKTPEVFLPPYNNHSMPSSVPQKLTLTEMPSNVYEDGACAVCYKRKRIITKGNLSLNANFNEKVFLFDSVECMDTFFANPEPFLIGINFRAPVYPELKYQDLPILGMLEQYVAKYVVQGVSFVARRRPIIPGLSVSVSALIGIGLFIKLKNEKLNPKFKPYYEEGFNLYNERRNNLTKYIQNMKTYRNPYLFYEEPLPDFQLPPASVKSESLTTMVSRIVDKCVDDIDIYLLND